MLFLLFVSFTLWILWSTYTLVGYRKSSIKGKTVLVTGGSSIIGRCIVLRLLQHGSKVIVWDSDRYKLEQLANEARGLHQRRGNARGEKKHAQENASNCGEESTIDACSNPSESPCNPLLTTVYVDFTERSRLHRVIKRLDHVDIIIFADNLVDQKHFLERTDESIEQILQTNAAKSLIIAQAFLPQMMRANAGSIVSVVDASAIMGSATHPDYAASQWAAVGAHESIQLMLRQECGSKGNVNTTLLCACVKQPAEAGASQTTHCFGLWSDATPDEVAEKCVWALRCGVERVYMPSVMVLYPLLRILPVPWFLRIAHPICSKKRADVGNSSVAPEI